jgi:hypothetical protein
MSKRIKRKSGLAALALLGGLVAQTVQSAEPLRPISLETYHRDVLRSWHALDLNGDGYISKQELRALPRAAQGMLASLRRADSDGDGRLSFKEVVAARMAAFEAADTDGNDELSPAEIEAYDARLSAERPAQKPQKSDKAMARP